MALAAALLTVSAGCAGSDAARSVGTAIYVPPTSLGGTGSVMFLPAPTPATAGVAKGESSADEARANTQEAEADAALARRDREQGIKASLADIAVACVLTSRFHRDYERERGRGGQELSNRFPAPVWRALPARAACGGTPVTFLPEGYGQFVTHIATTSDGRLVMLRGGWQAAPLAGAGGDCLYERRADDTYVALGCNRSWVS